jgi:signal peptidase I
MPLLVFIQHIEITAMQKYKSLLCIINPVLGFYLLGRYGWVLVYFFFFAISLLVNRELLDWLNDYRVLRPFGFSPIVGLIATIHCAFTIAKKQDSSTAVKWLCLPLFSLALPWLVQNYYSEIFEVQSLSMAPSLSKDELIVITKFSLFNPDAINKLERGQRVLFLAPRDDRNYIKRIVALSGERVDYRKGHFFINYQEVEQTLLSNNRRSDIYQEQLNGVSYPIIRAHKSAAISTSLTVPLNSVFVMGDSRDNSKDSRHFGVIDRQAIKGVLLDKN